MQSTRRTNVRFCIFFNHYGSLMTCPTTKITTSHFYFNVCQNEYLDGKNIGFHEKKYDNLLMPCGCNVRDLFKDTIGPSLHVLIKFLATITLVMAPLFLDI